MNEFVPDIPLLWIYGLSIPWLWGLLLLSVPRAIDRLSGPLAMAGAGLSAAALSISLLASPPASIPQVVIRWGWVEALGLEFLVLRDGLSVMFGLLIAWVSLLVTVYAWRYLPHANRHEGGSRPQAIFYALFSFFTAAMLGVCTAGNLLQLYFFWEITTLTSYLLIGYWNHQAEARRGARLALGMTVAGSMAMLVGFFWLAGRTGHWNLDEIVRAAAGGQSAAWLEGCTALILIGALAKSAQAPFSSWLPAAMHAPTPVSAFLHSSALLAAGVYLAARLYSVLHATAAWPWMLVIAGAVGSLLAGLLAVRQEKMKPLLAYSTIAQFAFMFTALGLGTHGAVKAALYAFFLHTFIKAGLFMTAGAVTHVTGHKAFADIGGLVRTNRVLALSGIVLALSLTGVPGSGAFYYEEEYFKAAKDAHAWGVYFVFLAGGVFSFVYILRMIHEIFFGRRPDKMHTEALPFSMGLAMAVPAAVAVLTAFYPDWMTAKILDPAVSSTLGVHEPMEISLHLNAVFLTSLAAMALGVLLWILLVKHQALSRLWFRLPDLYALGGRTAVRLYGRLSEAFLSIHTGKLGYNLRIFFGGTFVIATLIWSTTGWKLQVPLQPIDIPLTIVLLVLVATSAATILVRHIFTFILVLTLSGFAMAAAFILMGAPNIALAQVLVEILIDLSIILALKESLQVNPETTRFLQKPLEHATLTRWAIALGVGAMAGFGTYWATQSYPADAVGQWYNTEGLRLNPKADIVAVILTDYRALDTLIEIMVFTAGMFALLGLYWHEEVAGE